MFKKLHGIIPKRLDPTNDTLANEKHLPINTYVAEHISYHLQTISNTNVVIGLHCNECYDFEGYISFLVALVSLKCYLRFIKNLE